VADEYAVDGSTNFLGGQDASKIPALVPPDSYHSGVNLSVSKGVPTPRWGNRQAKLKFPTGGVVLPNLYTIPYATAFHQGRFQALIPYSVGKTYYLIVVVSGVIFLINQETFEVTVPAIEGGGLLNENSPRLNWSNAGEFLVIFDFPNFPVILQGTVARRADPALFEVPVSVLGGYNQNRLFISNAGNEFTGGDPTGSLAAPEAPVTFQEVELPASPYFGQIFQLSTNYSNDPITFLGFLQVIDTSTGIGPFLVGTTNAIYSYQTQLPRAQWEASQFGSVFVENAGIAGARSGINVNSDFFFFSSDGQLRSASMSRDEQKKWARVPISREVENWLKYWDKSLIPYTVLGYFNNKIFATVNPYRTDAILPNKTPVFDVAFGGMVVLELDNLATLGKDGQPAWAGLWTGLRPMDMCVSNQRMFVMSKDDNSVNELYEVDPTITYDVSKNGDIRYVESIIYTREYDFSASGAVSSIPIPFQNKDLHSIDLDLRNIQGDFSIDVLFKPSQASYFAEWGTFKHVAPWLTCGVPQGCEINGLLPHQFRDITIGEPIDGGKCADVSRTFLRTFRKLQLKFVIKGKYWELQGFKLKAKIHPQNELETSCNIYPDLKLCADCLTNDWTVGAFKTCQPQVS